MGLDMFLVRRKKGTQEIREEFTDLVDKLETKYQGDDNKLELIGKFTKAIIDVVDCGSEELAYWRKANHIHAWFNQRLANGNIEDCTHVPVTKEDVMDLVSDCQSVIDLHKKGGNKWKEFAEATLHCESGFFFGSTEYDEYYLDQTKETISMLNQALRNWDNYTYEYFYYAWW